MSEGGECHFKEQEETLEPIPSPEAVLMLPNLGRVLELPHSRVIPNFAGCSLGGTDEVSQGLGHIFHGVDQHHLCGRAEALVCGRKRGNRKCT